MKASPGRGKLSPKVTDEGAGQQQFTLNTPHPALRATFPPRGEGFSSGSSCKNGFQWIQNTLRCALGIISERVICNRAMPGGLRTARHCVFTGKAVTQTAFADAGSLREHSRQHENMLLSLRFVAQATVNRRNTQSTRKRSAREAHLSGCIPRQLNNFNKK